MPYAMFTCFKLIAMSGKCALRGVEDTGATVSGQYHILRFVILRQSLGPEEDSMFVRIPFMLQSAVQ